MLVGIPPAVITGKHVSAMITHKGEPRVDTIIIRLGAEQFLQGCQVFNSDERPLVFIVTILSNFMLT